MIALVRSEYLKLRTTQVWFWLLLASAAICVTFVIGGIASSNNAQLTDDIGGILTSASLAYVAVFVLGVLSVTTEFRYQTITPTVLTTPSRWRLITAKLITFALVGAGFAVVCVLLQLAVALPWLAARGVDFSFSDHYGALLAVFAALSLMCLVGLGVGALLRNQIVAVTVGLVFLLVVENIVLAIPGVKYAYPYLTSGLITSITASNESDRLVNGVTLFPIWGGVLGLLVWGISLALIGAGWTMNRDIT